MSHGGGGERIITDAANYLSARGHEVSILCLPFRGRGARFHLSDGVQYSEKPFHRFKADVCYHVYAPLAYHLFSCRAPRIAGLHGAVVADFETSPSEFLRQGIFVAGAYVFRELLGERALRSFDAVHTVNPKGLTLKHQRIFTIPNWVDCSRAGNLLFQKRRRSGKFRVLFVGKPNYNKGFDRFVTLSRMFSEDDIEFVATSPPGNGSFADNGKVRCIGPVPSDTIWDLYSTGGLLLHPTRKETFGLVILESLVSGTPVLTTPIPSHAVLKLPLQYASTPDGFAQEIKDVYNLWKSDYDGYIRLGEEGAEAVRHYDRRVLLPRFEAMLKAVADGEQTFNG